MRNKSVFTVVALLAAAIGLLYIGHPLAAT